VHVGPLLEQQPQRLDAAMARLMRARGRVRMRVRVRLR